MSELADIKKDIEVTKTKLKKAEDEDDREMILLLNARLTKQTGVWENLLIAGQASAGQLPPAPSENLEEMLVRVVGPLVSREVGPLKKSLDIVLADMLDPWEGIYSETNSVVEKSETANLQPVSEFYGMKKKGQCMVLGACTHAQITCAHIWPRYTRGRGLEAYELNRLDVNNPRNFLRLHKSIERAFDHKRLTFVPVSMSPIGELLMEVVLLDPMLFSEDITYNQTTVKFGTLHHKHFTYIFTPTKTPYTRLLSAHTIRAFSKGKAIGWPEAEQHEAEARGSAVEQARRSLGEESYAMKCLFK